MSNPPHKDFIAGVFSALNLAREVDAKGNDDYRQGCLDTIAVISAYYNVLLSNKDVPNPKESNKDLPEVVIKIENFIKPILKKIGASSSLRKFDAEKCLFHIDFRYFHVPKEIIEVISEFISDLGWDLTVSNAEIILPKMHY